MNAELRALSLADAEIEVAKATALQLFRTRYRHNPESQRAMVGALRRLASTFSAGRYDEATFPWELLVDEELTDLMWSTAASNVAQNTATRDASALRVLLDCLRRVELLTDEQHRHARSFRVHGGQARREAGHWLSTTDVEAILRSCALGRGGPLTRARDLALLFTLAGSGVRRDEVSQLRLEDLHPAERRIWLRNPKGGQPRSTFVHQGTIDALAQWLLLRGDEPGPVFVPLSRVRPLVGRGRLSDHQIWKVVRARAAEAGYANIAPHDLRRFFISNLLNTTDVVLVSRIVGHARPTTTAKYDKRPDVQQREAVASLTLPALSALRDGAARSTCGSDDRPGRDRGSCTSRDRR